ncbi:MAG: SpvB/TcaC N-terminal domain-containing protein, partial [Paludibacter sp.]
MANICLANAQYQNFNITTTNDDADSKSYIGRDYVRLQNGYSFSAKGGKTLNAKVQSGLNNDEVNTFLNFSTTTESDAITTIDKSKAIGQIPISSSVSPSGAKCYNVPIEVVSGRQGFQPNLTLAYNSQGDNGKVGIGWNISGLSSIERVNKNVFYDGKNDIPAFTTDDVFALDGIRLIRTSSTLTTITYETVTNNIKVTAYVSGNYFQYFKVMYPNGALAIYGYENGQDYLPLIGLSGNIDNSGIDKSKPTWLSYPITKSLDINSNVITYKYAIGVNISGLDNGFLMPYYIYEINYGKNGSINDFAKISFEYKTRKDIILYQQCGYYGMLRNILSGIKVYVGTNNIRTYQLDYNNQDPRLSKTDTENRFDVNRLIQINCNVGNELLNPLKFKYGTNNTVLTVEKDLTTLGSSNFDMKKINFSRGKLDANLRNGALIIYPKKNVYQKGS